MATDTVDLNFLGKQQERILAKVAQLRSETRQIRITFGEIGVHFIRQERRFNDLRDDLITMLKMEMTGSPTNFETKMDNRFDAISDRFDRLETMLREALKP
jgi:hypothetical protein